MKKLFFAVAAFLILSNSFGTSVSLSPRKLKADEVFIPIGTSGKTVSLMELSTMRMSELQTLTGKKFNFGQKVSFKVAQKKLRGTIAPDGTIDSKKFQKMFSKKAGDSGFHAGGFFLGLLLGLIGVLIAYLINDDLKQNRVKWAWIGCAIAVLLNLIIIVALL